MMKCRIILILTIFFTLNITTYHPFFYLNAINPIYHSNNSIDLIENGNDYLQDQNAFAQETMDPTISGINTGSYPIGINVNPITNKIYVTNQFSNTVSVFSSITDELIHNVEVGSFPYGMDGNLYNNRIYVTNRGSDDVSVLDGISGSLINRINVGQSPVQIKVNPSNNWIYVTNIDSNSVSIIDGITNRVVETIEKISTPFGINVNPISNKLYVTNIADSTVTVLDANNYEVEKKVKVGQSPVGIEIDLEKNLIFITNYLSNSVSVLNATDDSVIKTIPVDKSPVGVALNPNTDKLYISNIGSNTISIIDENNLEKIKDVKINPTLVSNNLEYPSIIPSNINFPLVASFVSIDVINNLVYATNTASNTITIIDGDIDERIIKVSFETKPEDSGFIECNGNKSETQNITSISTDALLNCTAIPERGYYFSSWSGLYSGEDNPIQLTTKEYGHLTATFRPTLAIEAYVFMTAGLIGASSVIIGYFFKGRQRRKFNQLVEITNRAIENVDISDKKESVISLENLRRTIFEAYKGGGLTDFQFDFLDKRLINYIKRIKDVKY